MGIFDKLFGKKNKDIETDNGLNQTFISGKLFSRFFKKDGKLDGKYELFSTSSGQLSFEGIYKNDKLISSTSYSKEGWVEKETNGDDVIFLYSKEDKLMTFDEILNYNSLQRPTRESIREEIKSRTDLGLEAVLQGADVDLVSKSGLVTSDSDIEKKVDEKINDFTTYEGVVLINNFAFIDSNFPNPIKPFSGKHNKFLYLEGMKKT